jgi:transposase InsO family protein
VDYACAEQYQDLTPYLIVAQLLTIGIYVAGVSSFYRILRRRRLVTHRGETAPRTRRTAPPERVATGPNQVWTWDITWLKTTVGGIFFYAYVVLDLWDRSVVGWRIEAQEDVELSMELFRDLKVRHGFDGLFVHSDNGSPMKGGTILELFYELGITPSFSRPRVSDDNPFVESFNSTMKRQIDYPRCFAEIGVARTWMADFVHYYNTEHLHSAIGYVTPHQRRHGDDHTIFAARNATLKRAFQLRPERWVRGPKYYAHEKTVVLNPAERNRTEKISKNMRQLH